jgi:predicted class III extradiol MEMO1 family dioxygenase
MKLDLDLLSFTVVSACFVIFLSAAFTTPVSPNQAAPDKIITSSKFFDARWFYEGLNYSRKSQLSFPQKPRIIIIPHHLVASYIMSDLIGAASRYHYNQIYLIGPNHFEAGPKKFLDGRQPESREFITLDHSIGNPMLYVSYFFPDTKVIPIIIKHDAKLADITNWTAYLASDKNSLYIFSLDFSHYLPANIATQKDARTWDLISGFDVSGVLTLDNDYVDSPSGLGLSLSLAQKVKAQDLQLIHHTNSGLLLSDFVTGTTSYFGIAFFTRN